MTALDKFANVKRVDESDASLPGVLESSGEPFNITPSDSAELTYVTRGLSFATAGALKVLTMGGNEVTIPSGALAAGIIHPIRVKKVFSTGTGALNIVGYA